jgi:cytoskeletal protein RodZ
MRVIYFDKGSKRQMRRIRWKLREVISVVVLSLIVLGLGILFALWEVSQYSTEPKTPHVEAKP